jgi:hypothetical protein
MFKIFETECEIAIKDKADRSFKESVNLVVEVWR